MFLLDAMVFVVVVDAMVVVLGCNGCCDVGCIGGGGGGCNGGGGGGCNGSSDHEPEM
jgi:hypothetical protein